MTSLNNLRDLYVQQIKDLYSAERQLMQALPKMAKAAHAPELKQAITSHLAQTEGHADRLQTILNGLDIKMGSHKCKAMEGIIDEGNEMLKMKGDPDVLDAGIIAAAQRAEHYEIAGYGCVRTYARTLGLADDEELLQKTLDEEGATDKQLTKLAEGAINNRAKTDRIPAEHVE